LRRFVYTGLIFCGLITLETVFIALSTGYLSVQFISPPLQQRDFFLSLARQDLATTLRFVFVDSPLLIIQSQHRATGTIVWSLHYFSLSVLIHLVLAGWLADIRCRRGPDSGYEIRLIIGMGLLIVSTLYLFLGSCCSGGPNWIVQTWLLAIVFNPITSSNATIQLYQSLKDGFVVVQLLSGVVGAYLLFRYMRTASQSKIDEDPQ